MDRLCAAYFSQEEQVVIMESYEDSNNIIMAKNNLHFKLDTAETETLYSRIAFRSDTVP